MDSPTIIIQSAFESLASVEGFTERASQRQLALLIGDLIQGDLSGTFEAPTGIGKSLATLIPSLVHAAVAAKRIVIATYTNVLAEQYWKKDVPFALELINPLLTVRPEVRLLMGRQRYCCVSQLGEIDPKIRDKMLSTARIGHETEFKLKSGLVGRTANLMWSKVSVPVVCPARLCPDYQKCFYYSARRSAARAQVVITNHSVVIQDAIMKDNPDASEGLLGDYDFLILDEAHDFPLAAANGLEFELNTSKLQTFASIGVRMGGVLNDLAHAAGLEGQLQNAVKQFESDASNCQKELQRIALNLARPGIVIASPEDLFATANIQSHKANITTGDISELGFLVEKCCTELNAAADRVLVRATERSVPQADSAKEAIRNYRSYLSDFARSIHSPILPRGVSVTHVTQTFGGAKIRSDVIGLAEPLHRLIWSQTPTAFLSATLTVDNDFSFFSNSIGSQTAFEEVLDAPFDYAKQAALYLPSPNAIPDPSEARKLLREADYYRCVAAEVNRIIDVCGGRTLVLFHSRKEMEAVAALVPNGPDKPILMQTPQGVAEVGEQFKKSIRSSLFALRSFWTGFDAPGETLSCVVLVRIPFEVPIDPPQVARAAHLQIQGMNPFMDYTLPMAKMLIRQGVGRLIRGPKDRGVIAILDPRIRTKRYGDQILDNLPAGMRTYQDIEEAAAAVGIDSTPIADIKTLDPSITDAVVL